MGWDGKPKTSFRGSLLTNAGQFGVKRRRFARNLQAGFNEMFGGRTWHLQPAYCGGAVDSSGDNTAIYTLGHGLKLGGNAGTTRGTDTGTTFGHSARGYYHGQCDDAANTETCLLAPRVFNMSMRSTPGGSTIVDGPFSSFIRFKVEDISSQDVLWGICDDDGDAVTLMTAGGAEDITNGLIIEREVGDAVDTWTLNLVVAGTSVATTPIVMASDWADDTFVDLGLIIEPNAVIAMAGLSADPDSAMTVVEVVSGSMVAAKNAVVSAMGPSFAVNSTQAETETFDIAGWGATQPFV